jgi:hypothetical protein
MTLIEKVFFQKYLQTLSEPIVPELTSDSVTEFKVLNKYFYKIENNSPLLNIHDQINNFLHSNVPINNSATAFRKNLSYLHFFEPHRYNYLFLRLDIKSFFHSIQLEDIKKALTPYVNLKDIPYIDDRKEQTLLDGLLQLVTYTIPENSENTDFIGKRILPMGFKTSPTISNIVFRKLDIIIQKFCFEKNIIYTRYADDMLFSASKNMSYLHSDNFVNEIRIYLSKFHLNINNKKTIRSKHTLSIKGYTLQYSIHSTHSSEYIINEFRLSNKKLNVINQLIHLITKENKTPQFVLKKIFHYQLPTSTIKRLKKKGTSIDSAYQDQLLNKITGYRSYLLSFIIFNNKYNCSLDTTKEKYLDLINKLEKLILRYTM